MLHFPYLDEPLRGPRPPSLAAGSLVRSRPLVPVTLHGPAGHWFFTRTVLDSGADDTIFPFTAVHWIGASLRTGSGLLYLPPSFIVSVPFRLCPLPSSSVPVPSVPPCPFSPPLQAKSTLSEWHFPS